MRWMAACLAALLLALMPAAALGEHEKVVYLTFDDGPKKDTPELLALLEELDVPATFFFMGLSVRAFPEYARQVVEAGYPVGCHSMGHKPSVLKENASFVKTDIERFKKTMRELADASFDTDLYRFPGGSSSYPSSVRRAVVEAGCAYFDWNGMTGDTLPNMNAQDLYQYALKTAGQDEVIILLMHEGKPRTREILPQLVEHFARQGYEFRALSTDETEREILARCPASMRLPQARE